MGLKVGRITDLIIEACRLRLARLQGKGWTGGVANEVDQALQILGHSPTMCIDIGGYKGSYSEELLKHSKHLQLVIFEPAFNNSQLLQEKFGLIKNVVIEPFAISDYNGEALLLSDKPSSPLGSLSKRNLSNIGIAFDEVEIVQTKRFEDYWLEHLNKVDIDICKIDIEGHELAALRGFGGALKQVKVVQFEFGGTNLDTRTILRDFFEFFLSQDFDLFRMSPLGPMEITRYSESLEVYSFTNFLARRRY